MSYADRITEIQIIPIRPRDGLVGFASFILDNDLYISSVGIYTRPTGGYRLTFPTRKVGDSEIKLCYPVKAELYDYLEQEISKKYEELIYSHTD